MNHILRRLRMASPQTHSPISKKVTSAIDGLQIYAEAIGDPSKPAIVYIHGNSSSSGVWDAQFFDEKLLKHFYQVRMDLRGHGLSETPPPEAETPFDDEQQASDVAAVLKEFAVQKPIFVGWSYGAVIPTDYITVHGHKDVRGVVIANGLTGEMSDIKKFFTSGPYPGLSDNSNATQMHHAYGMFIRDLTYKPLPREWVLRLRGMMSETETSTRVWIFKRKKNWDPYMKEASKTLPKLVVFGKQDRMNSLAFMDYIKEHWEPSLLRSEVIDGAGHMSFLEKPAEFNAILLDWALGLVKN